MRDEGPFEGWDGLAAQGLAWLYGKGQALHARQRLARVERAGVPVVSIGNLVVGGTGKTPLAAAIAGHFAAETRVAMLSRGHGGNSPGPLWVSPDTDPAEAGDEAVELAAAVPNAMMWTARDRVEGARAAVDEGARLILLDDGFAYRALHRDVDLVVFDERGIGNGRLLPAGPLREPLAGLARADAVLLRDDAPAPPGWLGAAFRFQIVPAGFRELNGTPVEAPVMAVAAAGIGWPGRFFGGLEAGGIQLEEVFPLADHVVWTRALIEDIEIAAEGLPILVTAKDAVKIARHHVRGRWLAAMIHAQLEPTFFPWLAQRLAAVRSA